MLIERLGKCSTLVHTIQWWMQKKIFALRFAIYVQYIFRRSHHDDDTKVRIISVKIVHEWHLSIYHDTSN